MRFYSQKIGRKIKKLIFRALKLKVWRFVSVLVLRNSISNGAHQESNHNFSVWKNHFKKFFVTSLAAVLLLAITSTAQSNVSLTRKLDTLHVVPGSVTSTFWQNQNESLIQDVDESAVYQSFSKSNSSHINREQTPDEKRDNSFVPVQHETQEQTDNRIDPIDVIFPNTETNELLPSRSEQKSDSEIVDPEVEDATVPHVEVPTQTKNEEPSVEPAPDSPLEVMSKGFFRFTQIAYSLLPFVQESVTTPIEESFSTVEGSANVDEKLMLDVIEPESKTAAEEVLISEEQAVTESKDMSNTGAESEVRATAPFEDDSVTKEPEVFAEPVITFFDFNLPKLNSGQFIKNAQLRMSLGALPSLEMTDVPPQVVIEYSKGESWVNAGMVLLDAEVSNALNGGYFLYALPNIGQVSELENFAVRVRFVGDQTSIENVFLDALWLELDTETIDRTTLNERIDHLELPYIKMPNFHELISSELDFGRTENPKFVLRYESQRNAIVKFFRSIFSDNFATIQQMRFIRKDAGPIDVSPQINMTVNGLWTIQLDDADREKLQPGTYTVEIVVEEGGKEFIDTFDFQWGVIAINPNQTEYTVGDRAQISLAALSQNGNTICDAELALYIIDPNEYISLVPVSESGLCNGNNVIDKPDYTAEFPVEIVGTYEMYVERVNETGEVLAHTSDTFIVTDSHDLWIERNGPTRIYPPALYPMQITVTSKHAFIGKLIERVPSNFIVRDTDAQVTLNADIIELSWDIDLSASSSATYSYSFDAPDISPYLYSLGPAEIISADEGIIVDELLPTTQEELLTENITTNLDNTIVAQDGEPLVENTDNDTVIDSGTVTEQKVGELDTDLTIPNSRGGVTVEEQEAEVVDTTTRKQTEESNIFEKIVDTLFGTDETERGDTTDAPEEIGVDVSAEIETDATSETPVASAEEPSITEKIIDILFDDDKEITPSTLEDSLITLDESSSPQASTTAGGVFLEHRKWQIASDATGSMIVFWTSSTTVPSGWTCVSCVPSDTFYNRFPYGDSTYGTTDGIATTTHTADATVNAVTSSSSENRAGTAVNITSHSHTFTPIIQSTTTLPAYRALRVIQNDSAGDPGTLPAGVVLIFDGTLPTGWSEYTELDDRYPLGQNTIVSSSTNTHVHNAVGTTSSSTGSTVDNRTGGTQASPLPAPAAHVHTMSTSTVATSHEPPYIQVIFATSSIATTTPSNAIAMWSDTPPAGWLNRSELPSDPLYHRFIKGASTYGTTGGAETHTHSNMSATTSSSTANTSGRTGVTGVPSTHKHLVDFSNFSTASNTPPHVSVIFAKFYGYIPIYNQYAYRFFANSTSTTPTDPWPSGVTNIDENVAIDSEFTPVKNGDVVRLRMQLNVSNSTSTNQSFKLQFASTSDVCTSILSTAWTDVGSATSSQLWIGYDNAGIADGTTLSSTTISDSDIFGSYEESNPSVTMPNEVGISQNGEWDFVVKQNNALINTNYCFRMVESDGTTLFSYTNYPMLVTNDSPHAPILTKLFNNEKVASTTPWFEFAATDPESDDLSYQIQIDDDYMFGSVNIDNDTVNHGDQFEDQTEPSEKDPFPDGDTIRFMPPSALSNGVTYYWRVRAQDPTGSNGWGDWSTIYSFTIDTSVTVSTWFQTTEEQFDSDTLVGTEALVSDLVQLISGSTTGTTTSSNIDFNDGSTGNAWDSLSWSDNETVGDIKYRVQYYDASTETWSFIPDADLSGNSVGFDTSPVSLLGVDVNTYSNLRLIGVFTNSGGTPTLSDWTISWGYRVNTPTNNAPFPSEKVSTTTPTFEFTTTDPQDDLLVYQISWSASSSFAASTTRDSETHLGFINISDGLNLSPFTSGDTIQFSVQTADTLVNGRTYWWRVRARDPAPGSNEYSFWTDAQSFTVDTSVTVSTWFQTTDEQFESDILSGAVTQGSSSVTVATTTGETLIVYAEGTISTPQYRIWDGSSWSLESSALDVGAPIYWVVTKSAPSENEYVLATMGTDGDVNAQIYNNGSWGNLQEITAVIANTNMRGFDATYETLSGDAMVVSCDGDANPTYYLWNGSTWTLGSTTIGLVNGNTCGWVKLISNPVSDEIIAITRDSSGLGYEARVWNGSSWGNTWRMGSMSQIGHEGIAAEYEDSGNQGVVAVSNGGASSLIWSAWNGANWSASTTQSLGDDFEAGSLVRDKGSDNMALCYIDQDADIGVLRWTGAGWVANVELETAGVTADNTYNDRPVDCVFEEGGTRNGYIRVVYSDTSNIRSRTWNGTSWLAEVTATTTGKGPRVQARRVSDNSIQVISYATTSDRYDFTYSTSTTDEWWAPGQILETDSSVGSTPFREPFMIAPKNPVTTGTVIGESEGINFYAGSGPYWQQMSWTDTESGGSSILYQVQYYNSSSEEWELIPDSLIPNNSIGTSTSPINLSNVLPVSTYSLIRPVATLTCNLGTCPILEDWTITWSAGITVSGTAFQYDQTSSSTAGTVAIALDGVLQTGKTGTIVNGAWSIVNVNASPGDVVTVFVNGAIESAEAVGIAHYDGVGDMTGMKLFERHVVLGSNDATSTPFTNAEFGYYDYTNDEDLFFNATGTTLDICAENTCADTELYISASTTYTPGGTLRTPYIENNGTFNMGGQTVYIGRSWDNNATTSSATSSVYFVATSTPESINETGGISPSFYNLTFGTSTGYATWSLVTTLDINGNLTVSRGILSREGTAITVAGSLTNTANGTWYGMGTTTFDGSGTSNWSDASSTLQNVGRVVVDGTSKTIQLGSNVRAESIMINADDTLDVSTLNYDLYNYGNFINNSTFVPRSGEVIFDATTTNKTITAGGDAFHDLTFSGVGGSWSFSESDLTVNNDFRIATGTVTMPTGTTTLAGSFSSVGGAFAHSNALIYFTSSGAETIAASGTPFTNPFFNLRFTGSGNFTFLDTSATTSNDILITQGTVVFPSTTFTIGGSFTQTGGSFTPNGGTVKFISGSAETIDVNSTSFFGLSFAGSGSWSFADASVTATDDVTITGGTVTFPGTTFTIGGSLTNSATISNNSATVLFNSTDTGESINLGSSSLYNMTFNGSTGGWTIFAPATTTNNTTLTNASSFVLASGQTLAVNGTFTNSVGGASTTWTGSTLSLGSGTGYSLNTKTNNGDLYETLLIKANTDIQMWNSSAGTYTVDSTGSLYSQDHASMDGDLYIFGSYPRTSGNEYWSYATDFDGTVLSTSTSRQVDVRFAGGASAHIVGSLFQVSGSTTATTTIANQGSGTYTIFATTSTTTFGRYEFTDLGSTGVTLSGTGVVTSLSDGMFEPATLNGTGLMVSSSTIDANAGLQIYRVNFSTTTAISAANVTQYGGMPTSYWWFRESTGNIDGEYFDADTGDPGSIRWDDSSLVITISGTVYSDDGATPMVGPVCDDTTQNIRIVVQGGASSTASCASADGSFSRPGVTIVGDPIVAVYLDMNGTAHGSVITKTLTTDITDLDMYQNRVITRHEDIEALTIEDLAVFDTSFDTDIQFDAATGTTDTLTVFAGNELHIASSTTFSPDGNITINANASSSSQDGSLHIDDNATFTGNATSTYIIGGSITMDLGATFVSASTSVTMNATTTGKTITTLDGQEITFNNLTFNGAGGGWNINGDIRAIEDIAVTTGTVSGTADVTVVHGALSGNGTLSFGSGTTTIQEENTLGGSTPWTFGNLVLGSGSVTGTTTPGGATTTILGKLTISTGHYLKALNTIWNLAGTGNVFVENGTFLEGTSSVRYSGTGATNILGTTYYNLDLMAQGGSPTYTATGLGIIVSNNLTIGGTSATTVSFDTSDPALDVNGNVTVDSTGTLVGSASASFTVAGNWDNNGIYTASNGTVTFDGSGSPTISAGNSSFANVTVNGSGTFIIPEHATATSAFTLTSAGSFTVSPDQALAVGGTFTNSVGGAGTTWTSTTLYLYGGNNYTINASTTDDDYETLRVGANTDIRMWNSSGATIDVSGSGSLYSMDHNDIDGFLYIFGDYVKTSGTDYWSYATDFDGTNLSGGDERGVIVYIAENASTTYLGGGLAVIGDASATTTVRNQGSGTYAPRIGGTASTTWNYYEVRDTNTSGLVFSGTPNVVSLSYGDFEVSEINGTAITVGGTVITQNPAKTFEGNVFASSTGVSPAYNVTATGTTVSSWRFTSHSGNIDGEAFDVDPDGDPGYIAWVDSAGSITISGNVFSDEGSSVSTVCDSSTQSIKLIVDGIASTTVTSCNGDGAGGGTGYYEFTGVQYSDNDPVIVYIDGVAQKAATVTRDPISNINNMDLYENRVIVRHEGADPLTLVDMIPWDSVDDPDVPFTAIDAGTDTLTLPANTKLIVWTNKEFEPNGNVTLSGGGGGSAYDGTLELYTNAVFDATGSESHSIGGSFISGSGATFDDETSTVTFTTSGSARTVDTNNSSFYNLVFTGSGSWTVTDSSLSVGNDFTITQGTVTLPSGTTTVTGSLLTSGGSFMTATTSTMLFNSSASENILAGGSNFGNLTLNGTGSFTLLGTNATVTADLLIQDGTFTSATGTLTIWSDFLNVDTFTHGSGILRFMSTSSALVRANGSDLYTTTFAGGGTYTFTDTNVALLGSLNILSGTTTLATGTMSIAGSFLNTGGAFNHSSGTILFNSGDTGEIINPGTSPFHVVSFASASGGWTISAHATTTSNFSLTSIAGSNGFTLSSSTRLYVGGVFTNLVGGAGTTWTGSTLAINSGTGYTINTKIAGGDTYNNVIVGSSTALRAWDSAGTITMADGGSSFYSQDHAGISGSLYIYGNYSRASGADYWSYATDFDGTSLSGSERQAYVYFSSGATTTITGGTLAIVGANGFDTTISNQGSGTYALRVLGGTLNAQYYSLSNMDADGLYLSGNTTVTSLTEGNFTLAVNGGSLLTLSSTTLNYNVGLVISGASFATTSAITGTNVELIGTTPSAWTFTGHTGNLDGEAFDTDGGDDCGSIRWDDSSCLLMTQSAYRFRNDDGGEGVPNSEWYDLSWTKRKRVTFTNDDAVSYTNPALKITVAYDGDMQTDFDDLRFTANDGTTALNYYRETYTASTDAVVWVEVPLLATSTVTDVYMYYGNGGVADVSATSTFNFIDNFEDGNITEYSGDTGEFVISNTSAYERTYRLNASDPNNGKTDFGGMYNNSYTVRQGEMIRYLQYIDATQTGDETCTTFGTQSQTQNYGVCLELFGTDRMSLVRDVLHRDTSGTVLSSTTVSFSTGWYEVEIAWDTDDSIYVSLYQNGSLVATTTDTDTDYTSGGVGYTLWTYHGGWDMFTSRPLLGMEPAVSFGHEQVAGGASWLAALNTSGSGVSAGENLRVRFLIENTGLTVTDQNYEIEFAGKGASPSCEAVDYADFVEIPDAGSCGSNEICMALSNNITNLASTTDILGGDGTFTYGQIVEDPSNNTGNITIDGGEYTELEYVITPTPYADDSNYCLRVSNEGTDLDSYTKVAEFGLVFVPDISALFLNGDSDIILTGGTTTRIYATGTVSDANGYSDLIAATTTIFRSGVGSSCTLDNNNCYIAGNSQCSFYNCSVNTCDVSCYIDMYYHADPTDIGTYAGETWRAELAVKDGGNEVATATAASIDLITLRALAVDSGIDYGSLEVNADTGSYNATTTVENIGNDAIDIEVEGTDLTDGGSSAIPVSEQIFSTSTFTYSACTFCSTLDTIPVDFNISLVKPTTTTPAITDELFWGIAVPFGVAGTPHEGVNTFYATANQ